MSTGAMPTADDNFNVPEGAAADVPPQAQAAMPPPVQPQEDPVNALLPRTKVIRELGLPNEAGKRMEYTQQELSFFGKWELSNFLGVSMKKLLEVQQGQVTLWEFLSSIGFDANAPFVDGSKRADVMIRGVARLAEVVPEALEEYFCIVLQVPRELRPIVTRVMRNTRDEGGLDDDTAFDILELSYDQNRGAFDAFFVRLRKLFGPAVEQMMERLSAGQQPSSTPSKDSPPTTPSPST